MAAIIYDSNRGMVNTNHNQGKGDVMYGGADVSHKGAASIWILVILANSCGRTCYNNKNAAFVDLILI